MTAATREDALRRLMLFDATKIPGSPAHTARQRLKAQSREAEKHRVRNRAPFPPAARYLHALLTDKPQTSIDVAASWCGNMTSHEVARLLRRLQLHGCAEKTGDVVSYGKTRAQCWVRGKGKLPKAGK